MSTASRIWIEALGVVAIVALAISGRGDAQEVKYSGTVVAVDQTMGTIVIEDMGPWRIKEGMTQVERRTIGIAPSTEVKPGDWVIVTMKSGDQRPTAARVTVWEPRERQ